MAFAFLEQGQEFGEKMLWMAVLRRAVFDFVLWQGRGGMRIEWQEAAAYIFDDDYERGDGPSFTEVCGLFGWNVEYLRRIIREIDRSSIKKMEVSAFRDETDLEGAIEELKAERHWWGIDGATPYFTPLNYAGPFRNAMEPKVVGRESLISGAGLMCSRGLVA